VQASAGTLRSVRVAWSADAGLLGRQVLMKLASSTLNDVANVQFSDAIEIMARRVGSANMAVCVIEPDSVTALMTVGGRVQRAASDEPDDDRRSRWLAGILERDDWRPQAVVAVGSTLDLDAATSQLRQTLAIPIISRLHAQLALARAAAAVAPAQPSMPRARGVHRRRRTARGRGRPMSFKYGRAIALAAELACVAAVIVAICLFVGNNQLEPDRAPHVTDAPNTPPDGHEPTPPVNPPPEQPPATSPGEQPLAPVNGPPVPAPPARPPSSVDVPRERTVTTRPQPPASESAVPVPQAPAPPAGPAQPPDGPTSPSNNCTLLCGITL
jgi:hypothetical protein